MRDQPTELCRAVKLKMTMNSTEIKACPTCGGEATARSCNIKGVVSHWKVKCPSCGSSGPYSTIKDLAINFWNYGAGGLQPAMSEVEGVKASVSATGSVAWWIVMRPHQKWSRDECGHLPIPIAAFINEGLAKEWIASEAHRNRDIIQPPNDGAMPRAVNNQKI